MINQFMLETMRSFLSRGKSKSIEKPVNTLNAEKKICHKCGLTNHFTKDGRASPERIEAYQAQKKKSFTQNSTSSSHQVSEKAKMKERLKDRNDSLTIKCRFISVLLVTLLSLLLFFHFGHGTFLESMECLGK